MDKEDLIKKILAELGDDYKELVHAIQAHDTPITFDELHEKLLTFESSLQGNTETDVHFLTTSNPVNRTNTNRHPQNSKSN